ncbi:hypothetical protein ACP70R_029560 [Stipagrostis hirtigluma subsp. patula]
MPQRGTRTAAAAEAAAAAAAPSALASSVTNHEDLGRDGSTVDLVEVVQEEVLDLKSRVGNVEGHLSSMQVQLTSIQKLLTEFVGKPNQDEPPEESVDLKTTADEEAAKMKRIMNEKQGKRPMGEDSGTEGIPHPDSHPSHGYVYTEMPDKPEFTKPADKPEVAKNAESHATGGFNFKPSQSPKTSSATPPLRNTSRSSSLHRDTPDKTASANDNGFSLSIARPKLDFPHFHGDDPISWTRQCEKYFDLAAVPEVLWVSMATLHCHGKAENWWASLRIKTHSLKWPDFCNLVVSLYIDKFEELMAIVQRLHPSLPESYYVQCFTAGLKDSIKHYLKPHMPQTLCHAYWIAKDLEKAALARRNQQYQPGYNRSNPAHNSQAKPVECYAPWTPKHKQKCKFYKAAAHALSLEPEEVYFAQQLLDQMEPPAPEPDRDSPKADEQNPHLMQISKQAVQGTRSISTFCLLVTLNGKRGVALVDSGSTHTFLDVTFASKAGCLIEDAPLQSVVIAGGGELFSGGSHVPRSMLYVPAATAAAVCHGHAPGHSSCPAPAPKPGGSALGIQAGQSHCMSPKHTSSESGPEECHSSDAEEDPYFKSLGDNFIAAADLGKSTLLDDIDMEAHGLRMSKLYAESALKYYNNEEKNKAKYELIRVITFYEMLDDNGCYGHVNFVAKGDQQNSDEELFFAELRWDYETVVPTCVLSLEGVKGIGGLCGTVYGKYKYSEEGLPMDSQHCYACRPDLQHPKNGKLYETGHVAMGCYYNEHLLG